MFLKNVSGGTSISMLEKTLAFNEARQRMLATNIANINTPGYRTKQLDVASFQAALREAADRRDRNRSEPFRLERTREFELASDGRLSVRPSEEPVENLLFKDGTNASIERQMSQVAETAMTHQVATELLKRYFDTLEKSIRGRVV
ncbi:MAG: flagellar basal body rod protein FlgB [Planctomycetota bacterium]|nr:MAG: flagellar basal body rod protein FlgB [Planctomycetota bacterium]